LDIADHVYLLNIIAGGKKMTKSNIFFKLSTKNGWSAISVTTVLVD